MSRSSLLDQGITPEIVGVKHRVMDSAHRVHRKLGAGFKESVYRECLAHAMTRDGMDFRREVYLTVEFEGLVLRDAGHVDFIIEDCLILEAKATLDFHPTQGAQIVNYLKASGLPAGILLNFNVPLLKQGYRWYEHPDIYARSKPDGSMVRDAGAGTP